MQQRRYENPDLYIQEKMKQFQLVDMREQYHDLIQEAMQNNLGYKEFLLCLLQTEKEWKAIRHQEKLLNHASLDSSKHLSQIDYRFNPSLDKERIEELGKLTFLQRHKNIVSDE